MASVESLASDGQDRGDEHLRVGVLRVVEDLVGQAGFNHSAALHHHQAVREQACDAEVVPVVPLDPWDRRVDLIITPTRSIATGAVPR